MVQTAVRRSCRLQREESLLDAGGGRKTHRDREDPAQDADRDLLAVVLQLRRQLPTPDLLGCALHARSLRSFHRARLL